MHPEIWCLYWGPGPQQLPLHHGQQPVQPEVLLHPVVLVDNVACPLPTHARLQIGQDLHPQFLKGNANALRAREAASRGP